MPIAAKTKKMDQLLAEAEAALRRHQCFEAERLGQDALDIARATSQCDRLISCLRILKQARMERRELAVKAARGRLKRLKDTIIDDMKIKPGCYLIDPPQVGADGRRLRLAAFHQQVPLLVLCREPLTQLSLVPVASITPGYSLRCKVKPPATSKSPTLNWLLEALEALGDSGIDSVDPELPVLRRLEALLLRIDALPEHARLHDAAIEAAQEAAKQPDKPAHPSPTKITDEAGIET